MIEMMVESEGRYAQAVTHAAAVFTRLPDWVVAQGQGGRDRLQGYEPLAQQPRAPDSKPHNYF